MACLTFWVCGVTQIHFMRTIFTMINLLFPSSIVLQILLCNHLDIVVYPGVLFKHNMLLLKGQLGIIMQYNYKLEDCFNNN